MDNKFSINLAWPIEMINREKEYQDWIEICKKSNIDCIRVFLVPWGINPIESSDDIKLLCEIIRKAREVFIEVVLVLDTYVNYVMHSYRDFINSDYGWLTNSFSKDQSLTAFLTEKGKTKYLDKISGVLQIIEPYENVNRIELCNEIDQIESKQRHIVCWINNSIKELRTRFGNRFEYRVSISNHRDYCFFSKRVNCKCDIHSYRFPYNTALENYEYINLKYPHAWISEFAYYSDFAYSETIESKVYFSAMILCAYIEKCIEFPAPWWWEKILSDSLYMSIYDYLSSINVELKKKETSGITFKELVKKKHDEKVKKKIRYRLSILKTNPCYVKQEFPAILKFLGKMLHPQYNHNYAIAGYESRSGNQYIILETYVPIETTCNFENGSIGMILCIDVIRNQKTISIKLNETILLREGTYLFIIQK